MEKLSRVKKYEDLRKQIEENAETEMDLEKETSMETLHTIEPAHYKKVKIEGTLPKREQMEQFEEHTDTFQFKNEFLDEFINEVREYNLKKGNRYIKVRAYRNVNGKKVFSAYSTVKRVKVR